MAWLGRFFFDNFTFTYIHIELLAFNGDLWTPIYRAYRVCAKEKKDASQDAFKLRELI